MSNRHPNRLRGRLTYANVTATLALFVALSTGGAYAANQLGKGSVGPKQIRKDAVRSKQIKNGGVALRDFSKQARAAVGGLETAKVKSDGEVTDGTASDGSFVAPNTYKVTFKRSVGGCTYAATPAAVSLDDSIAPAASARITGQGTGSGGGEVTVSTYDPAGSPVASGFHLLVAC